MSNSSYIKVKPTANMHVLIFLICLHNILLTVQKDNK